MDRFDKFLAWLSNAENGDPTASADREAEIVTDHLPVASATTTNTASQPAVLTVHTTASGETDEMRGLRLKTAALEKENDRLKTEAIRRDAQTFVSGLEADMKIMPASEGALVEVVAQAMIDDQSGPIRLANGSQASRTSLLANFFAQVESRGRLLGEALDSRVLRAVADRADAEKLSPSENPTDERINKLLSYTPAGQAVLAERKNGR